MGRDLREGTATMKDVEGCIEWDYSSYFKEGDVESATSDEEEAKSDPYWICPGSGKVTAGKHAAQNKFARKRKCEYYLEKPPRTYNRETSRRLCCAKDENGGKIHFSQWIHGNPGRAKKRRKAGK